MTIEGKVVCCSEILGFLDLTVAAWNLLPPKKNGPIWNVEMDPLGNCMFWGMGLEM
jgi:hypothetical protein